MPHHPSNIERAPRPLSRRGFLRVALGGGSVLLLAACSRGTSGGAATSVPAASATSGAAISATSAAAPTAAGVTSGATTVPASGATAGASIAPAGAAAGATPATTAAATLKGARIHLLYWSSFVPAEDAWFKQTLVSQWAQPNGVEMTIELVGQNDVQPKVVAALQAGAGPDVVQMQWNWPHLYADKLLDVTDIADPAGSAGGGWFEACKQTSFVNGKYLAMPFGIQGNAVAHRVSVLKDATGSDTFPATWDDYTNVGKQVKDKSGSFVGQALGHSYGDPPTFVMPFLWSYGGSETDETGKKITINSSATADALKAFKSWFDACSDQQCLSWDDSANNRAYLAGQIWATLNGASIYLKAKSDNPDIYQDTHNVLLPKGPKGQFVLGTPYGFGIPKYVQDPTPAKELLRYLMDPKTMGSFMQASQGYTLAAYKKGAEDLWPQKDPNFEPFRKFGDLSKWYGYPAPPSPAAAEAGSKYIVVDMFAKVAQGDTPDSAMQWAEGELKNVYGL